MMKGDPMNEEKEAINECIMHETYLSGDPNLCCCYIVDPEGRVVDPCYRPVSDCC